MLESYPVLSLHGLKLCKFVSRSDFLLTIEPFCLQCCLELFGLQLEPF